MPSGVSSHIFALQSQIIIPVLSLSEKKHPAESEGEDNFRSEEERDKAGDVESKGGAEIDNKTSGNGKVIMEMGEDDSTWADVLDEDEHEIQGTDITIDGEEIQYVIN
ncbi:hypothetical protein FPSE_03732 [Fusarium pseudograminearum CS3096]|uniref:Uncharacterized protein n=1 Tax=Fusarium pseudograminearum (strain CS3096) TaxID=1028729 RepID=K3W1L3_FUSPC|nr:hypothetical protein FPSE_03732 [Fusarium pseudograminearum CS3096]EKJ76100.1 hypothetical protein FPSE_03732 [Fusarium pseudograminearum CS3096]